MSDIDDLRSSIRILGDDYSNLVKLCQSDAGSDTVAVEVRHRTQTLLTEIIRFLDRVMSTYFRQNIEPGLEISAEEVIVIRKNVYFPIADKPQDLSANLGMFKAGDLKTKFPSAYGVIEKVQPYNPGMERVGDLKRYSNLGHRTLTPQTKRKDYSITLEDTVRISDGGSVVMRNCLVMGKLVKNLLVSKDKLEGEVEAGMSIKRENSVTYVVTDAGIDILDLCQRGLAVCRDVFQGLIVDSSK